MILTNITSLPTELPQSIRCIANIVRLKTVIYEIHTYANDASKLLEVGKLYFDDYIRPFRANKCRTPTPSSRQSRPSFGRLADMISATLVEAPQSHSDAKKNAMVRDGYRCVVTAENRELTETIELDLEARVIPTKCGHIFPQSMNSSIAPSSGKIYAAAVRETVNRFGHKTLLPTELNGSGIHHLQNVMTLEIDFHVYLDELAIWFATTNEKNKYKLKGACDIMLRNYPNYVTFATPDPIKLPVPSPTYLAIHVACTKIAHFSGATEYIDKLYRDLENSTALDTNGASADMLEHALLQLRASGYKVTA
ncbi:hypothetical protein BDQ12DRAFT_700465 [Crucibulum laeve]|uniref:HNH nuclease domain-containing protein n=1 Tax=Crucibulum laeve TaxID=68775 RepID=A0A5C3LMJ7_9AGAR|nr:hypothetical protein BDQ12DRAFT_700465 [Crucibulum laeve]